jgi:uncharacterized protein (AIM24 family)
VQSDLEQFSETTSTEAFALQNHKLLKVHLDQVTIQAKLGSMVAYQGEVSFDHAGAGGLGRLVKKVASGEGQSLMKISGRGEVFLADAAQDVHLFYLQDDRITVNGRNVLAFDDGIDWDIERVKSVAGMVGGGLFNTKLQGTGWVAVLTDGRPLRLDVGQAPTFADAQAAVAWSSGVTTTMKTDLKLKSFVGLGSGETFQMAFGGEGWVLVQPSEGQIMVTAKSGG